MIVVLIALVVLVGLADDGADAGSGRAADDGPFQPAAEEGAEDGTAAGADERSFARTDAALIVAMMLVVVTIVAVIVLAAVAALTDAVIEVGISIVVSLRADREHTGSQNERSDEYGLPYLHHPGLDGSSCRAGYPARHKIFEVPPHPGLIYAKSSFHLT